MNGRPAAAALDLHRHATGSAAGRAATSRAGRLTSWLRAAGRVTGDGAGALLRVWNPLPATGGTDPEPLEQVRQLAPSAFRHPAAGGDSRRTTPARPRRSPACSAASPAGAGPAPGTPRRSPLDPVAARADDPALDAAVSAVLEVRRMAGVDVELAPPVYVPLLDRAGRLRAAGIRRRPRRARCCAELSAATACPTAGSGFFHPDRFTFGQPLYVSDVVATAMAVPGVAWVDVRTVRPARRAGPGLDGEALAAGRIDVAAARGAALRQRPGQPRGGAGRGRPRGWHR